MSDFTKGDWVVREFQPLRFRGRPILRVVTNTEHVALVEELQSGGSGPAAEASHRIEMRANADLIAAAPRLVAELEKSLVFLLAAEHRLAGRIPSRTLEERLAAIRDLILSHKAVLAAAKGGI